MRRKISQHVRFYAFWILDSLKGSCIKKEYTNISANLTNGNDDKRKRLEDMLNHVKSTVPFYQNNIQLSDIDDFPVVNKNIIKDDEENFISALSDKSTLIPVVTSGSTGTPFRVYHDKRKKNRNTADTIYFAKLGGFKIGDKLIYLKIWAKEKLASPVQYWQQNMIPVDVIDMTDSQIASLIDILESKKDTFSFLGYVSAMENICKYLDRTNGKTVKTSVSSIITMSESLTEYAQKKMQQYFSTNVYSRYSNLENGIIAQQVPGSGNRYLINTASYFLEILNMSSDKPVKKGEAGRIVVTDLYNYAMPMVRYDTGDVGVISDETDEYGNLFLERVEGRKLDLLYATDGRLISSYIVYKNMWKYPEIDQYQLVQEGEKKYEFKISIKSNFLKEEQLISEFKNFLGNDADFTVQYIDEIPLLSSGKRKKIVNNYRVRK